ncbi:MAG: SWIM zinc finger family protein [Cyanobacteria bacterium]|nr:SWIM zinc finger family protein [Cyanobacteriota bacterium]
MISQPPQPDYELEQEAWWVERWVDLLNQYRFKKRLERGRRYAREGNILNLEHNQAKVTALVQGTAEEPYQLSIWLDAFTDEDWTYVTDSLATQALFSAQLLAGEMPSDIETVFTSNGLNLFPFTLADVHSRCSCPDPKNPCKHIAAVYYQLGDFFREDPFILFQLRGRTKEQILAALRQKRYQQVDAQMPADAVADDPTEVAPLPQKNTEGTPLSPPLQLDQFWQYDQPLDTSLVVVSPASETPLDVLNTIPLPTNDARVVTAYLREVYQTVSQNAAMTAINPDVSP